MRPQNLVFGLILLAGAAPARAAVERSFQPFFDLSLSQSVYVPGGKDTYFSGGEIDTSVGALLNLDDTFPFRRLLGDHALFGLYNLAYNGPGFNPQDQGEFEYRSLSHNFSFEYRWRFLGPFRVRPGVGLAKTFVRSGANETWGEGLYDNDAKGGQLAFDWLYSDSGMLTGQVLYRKVTYPNFTDLLREFQSAGSQSETSGGLQDNKMFEYSVTGNWRKFFGGARLTTQDYDNEKVVEVTGPNSGTYGSTAQKTDSTSLYGGFNGKLWRFEIAPQATFTKFGSNQNFLYFDSFGDTSPDAFANWYSYKELRVDVPFYLNLTKEGTALTVGWSLVRRNYDDRVARDSSGASKGEAQVNTMSTLSGGFRFRVNEVAYMKLLGGIVVADSNNTFERYLPYNYTGYTGGLSFELAY